ncbi:MAG: DUF2935 domain-containing protein [Negativicutes bacterium]|nr:DUF2935 domain-containing protein [Negativicutes bacterium]
MDIFCRDVVPFVPLAMHEISFWLRIMKEHALFICLGLPCDQNELREDAQKFHNVFEDLEQRICAVHGGEDLACFVEQITVAVKNVFIFKRHVLRLLMECKICGGSLYPLFVDHLSREALYFLKLLQKFRDNAIRYPVDAMISENVFWLRIMADHLKFIRGLTDPAERQLLGQLRSLSDDFDQLGLQARDLHSMLWHYQPTDGLIRVEKDVMVATAGLRDFLCATERLIKECAALTITPPPLADHVRREAEHFLRILDQIRAALLNDEEPSAGCVDYD